MTVRFLDNRTLIEVLSGCRFTVCIEIGQPKADGLADSLGGLLVVLAGPFHLREAFLLGSHVGPLFMMTTVAYNLVCMRTLG